MKFAAVMAGVLAVMLPLTGCDNNDDDAPDAPDITINAPRPISIIGESEREWFSFSYDSDGRMTRAQLLDYVYDEDYNILQTVNEEIQVSYSPFKYIDKVDDYTMTMTDASFNKRGFISKVKVTATDEYETVSYWVSFGYDSDGHLTSMDVDGEKNNITWIDGNLVNFGGELLFSYSDEKNSAKNICIQPYYDSMAQFWMTGLFGEIPVNFPNKVTSPYDSDYTSNFSYTLNSDGSIKTETITNDEGSFTFDYVYSTRSLDRAIGMPTGEVKSPMTKKHMSNPLRRFRK